MVRLTWTDQVLSDLISIAEFISRDSERYAKLTVKKIRSKVKILKNYPISGRIVPELNDPQIQGLILGNNRIIYYIVSKSQIDVLAIYHSARLL